MTSPLAEFKNEPPANFADEANRIAMQEALTAVATKLGGFYPLVIGGAQLETDERLESINPSHKRQVVGSTAAATAEHSRQAVDAARKAFPAWSATSAEKRADFLHRAARAMHDRRFELSAWEVYECGKGWREADGDVCEARLCAGAGSGLEWAGLHDRVRL